MRQAGTAYGWFLPAISVFATISVFALMTIAILLTAVLLLFGTLLRMSVPLFGWLYIPASVIGGFLGLFGVQLAAQLLDSQRSLGVLIASSAEHWTSWPGTLIAIVFAGMLLERPPASILSSLRRAGREGLMVWIIVLGQSAIGLLATWLLIGPIYGVPDAFGMLIETGFAGGHGTAAAMGQVFEVERVGLDSGQDLGVMMATIGLVYGIVSGVFWINIGVRRGWTQRPKVDLAIQSQDQTPIDRRLVRADVIDPFLAQAVWLAIAFGIGMLMQWIVNSTAQWVVRTPESIVFESGHTQWSQRSGVAGVISSFPLFIYTLFGGLFLRRAMSWFGISTLIDPVKIRHISSSAMEVLIVAAIASLNVSVVTQYAGSIAILAVLAAVWTAVCLVVLSRRILPPDHWFELGLINYGMSTGTTATGFVLLRMIDPELDSGAAEDYALAAPLSSPFVGGGMLTIGIPLMALGNIPLGVVAISLATTVGALILIGLGVARRAAVAED